MKKRFLILFVVILLTVEFAFYKSIYALFSSANYITFLLIVSTFVSTIAFVVFISYFRSKNQINYKLPFYMMGVTLLLQIPKTYIFIGFVLYGALATFSSLQSIAFSILVLFTLLAAIQFFTILYGIIWGRFNFKLHQITLRFANLPADLHNTKIVQISDLHLGSFFKQYHKLEKAIEIINSVKPSYVFFTGDLVNNYAKEADGWEDVLGNIKAENGVYSILGNHDYGDYVPWDLEDDYQINIKTLIEKHKELGFKVLLNENITLSAQENKAYLIGVENWGAPPFKKYGNLKKAMQNIPADSFKILLSHDPSHFDYEVKGKTNIDLTLSGHTHGMQFGLERWGIKWSLVKFKYPKWAGLYKVKNQFLYVNRGLGYIGFPGRVGIYPEITEITLLKDKTESQN